MGDAADDLIDGWCCERCQCYFEDDHGYPVVCKDCWAVMSKKDRANHQLATNEEI